MPISGIGRGWNKEAGLATANIKAMMCSRAQVSHCAHS